MRAQHSANEFIITPLADWIRFCINRVKCSSMQWNPTTVNLINLAATRRESKIISIFTFIFGFSFWTPLTARICDVIQWQLRIQKFCNIHALQREDTIFLLSTSISRVETVRLMRRTIFASNMLQPFARQRIKCAFHELSFMIVFRRGKYNYRVTIVSGIDQKLLQNETRKKVVRCF